jgi:hypothetical protein
MYKSCVDLLLVNFAKKFWALLSIPDCAIQLGIFVGWSASQFLLYIFFLMFAG